MVEVSGYFPNIWIKGETTREIRKYFLSQWKFKTAHQNVWETANSVLNKVFIALNPNTDKQKELKSVIWVFTLRNCKKSKLNPKETETRQWLTNTEKYKKGGKT